jgi:hypothetical protein
MPSESTFLTNFKQYIKSIPSREDQDAMEMEYYAEGDRPCAILQAIWVEIIIERTLRARLRHEGAGQIFDLNGPLGRFSDKITMAYGMGIFGSQTKHDLNLIREIRNGFRRRRPG